MFCAFLSWRPIHCRQGFTGTQYLQSKSVEPQPSRSTISILHWLMNITFLPGEAVPLISGLYNHSCRGISHFMEVVTIVIYPEDSPQLHPK